MAILVNGPAQTPFWTRQQDETVALLWLEQLHHDPVQPRECDTKTGDPVTVVPLVSHGVYNLHVPFQRDEHQIRDRSVDPRPQNALGSDQNTRDVIPSSGLFS